MISDCPLIAPASGAAKNATAKATSSGSIRRPSGAILASTSSPSARPVRASMFATVALVMSELGRLVEPDEVAFAVAFFAAPEAAAINGQTILIDGGGVQL